MKVPIVSVIIPCFNAEKYVGEAIQSALDQTYPEKEIIVIDDGSTDGSLDVIRSFGDRLRWETGPHRGACAARNRGVNLSSGVYEQFVDADDQLAPDKLRHQSCLLEEHGFPDDAFIAGAATRYSIQGQFRIVVPLSDPWMGLTESQLGNTCANLFPRKLIETVGGWDESMSSSQEYDLMFRLLKSGASVIVDPAPLTGVYDRPDSISRKVDAAYYERFISLRVQIREFLRSQTLLTADRERRIDQVVHDATRWLYQYDRALAAKRHKELLGKRFEPATGSKSYRLFYRMFGFAVAEALYACWSRLRRVGRRVCRKDLQSPVASRILGGSWSKTDGQSPG